MEQEIDKFAKAIIAVSRGNFSTFEADSLKTAQEIIKFLQIGNISSASQKIIDIFKKSGISYESNQPAKIARRITDILNL